MHKSRLAGFIIDCRTGDLDAAADFWSAALGLPTVPDPDSDPNRYRKLETAPDDLDIEVQKVDHESRVHLDIETDDIAAEVARLEALGAREVGRAGGWVIMQAPTGQRFCVVRVFRPGFEAGANTWR